MKALFLGNVAADTANGIRAELPRKLRVEIVAEPQALLRAPEVAAEADILVTKDLGPANAADLSLERIMLSSGDQRGAGGMSRVVNKPAEIGRSIPAGTALLGGGNDREQ